MAESLAPHHRAAVLSPPRPTWSSFPSSRVRLLPRPPFLLSCVCARLVLWQLSELPEHGIALRLLQSLAGRAGLRHGGSSRGEGGGALRTLKRGGATRPCAAPLAGEGRRGNDCARARRDNTTTHATHCRTG